MAAFYPEDAHMRVRIGRFGHPGRPIRNQRPDATSR